MLLSENRKPQHNNQLALLLNNITSDSSGHLQAYFSHMIFFIKPKQY